jgi:hypothetical protein
MERFRHILGACASLTIAASLFTDPVVTQAADGGDDSQPLAANCRLAPGLKHVVQIQFDNVHLRRDNPNVPRGDVLVAVQRGEAAVAALAQRRNATRSRSSRAPTRRSMRRSVSWGARRSSSRPGRW